jgi:hypothetical protein
MTYFGKYKFWEGLGLFEQLGAKRQVTGNQILWRSYIR